MNARLKVGTILAGAALAATTVIAPAAAAGANLLNNGALMPTTAGWAKVGEGTFTSAHFAGATLINTKDTKQASIVVAYQCVSLPDNWTYTLKGSLNVQPDQERNGAAQVQASYYPTAGCSGPNIDTHASEKFTETDGWTQVAMHLGRTNGQKAKSMAIYLRVEKDETDRFIKKDKPFVAQFRKFELTGDPADDGPFACPPDCGGASEEPPAPAVPPKAEPTPEKPTLEPKNPVVPGGHKPVDKPKDSESPADAPSGEHPVDDIPTADPATDDEPGDSPSVNVPGPDPQTIDLPGEGDDHGAPSEPPTLEPQDSNGPIHSATPTPPPPATGGDGPLDPADDLDSQDSQSDAAGRSKDDGGMPLGLVSVLGMSGLGFLGAIGVAARRKKRS